MTIQVDSLPISIKWEAWRNWLTRSVFPKIKNGPFILDSYTVATVPDATQFEGGMIYVSDETGGAVLAFSDGTNWRRVTDRAIVS